MWAKAKTVVIETTGTLTIEALQAALPHVMKMVMERH